jgi:uncharacterized protein
VRAIDIHVHPMDEAYAKASGPFMPAEIRMVKGKFPPRPTKQIVEDFRQNGTRILNREDALTRAGST